MFLIAIVCELPLCYESRTQTKAPGPTTYWHSHVELHGPFGRPTHPTSPGNLRLWERVY